MRYFLSLGSNLGDRRKNLERAAALLEKEGVTIRKSSSVYETSPVDYLEQPLFLNQVMEVESRLPPRALLRLVKRIEKRMGRVPSVPKGPRCIDIDILLAGECIMRSRELSIPHPELENRRFLLVPLNEIAPSVLHPVLRLSIHELWRRSADSSMVRRADTASGKEEGED